MLYQSQRSLPFVVFILGEGLAGHGLVDIFGANLSKATQAGFRFFIFHERNVYPFVDLTQPGGYWENCVTSVRATAKKIASRDSTRIPVTFVC